MKLTSLIFLILFPIISLSQTLCPESIFSATDNRKVDGYAQISWTLGDCQISTFKSDDAIITSGFLQTRLTITGIENYHSDETYSIKLFPNPVKDILYIEFSPNRKNQITLNLYSANGKIVMSKIIESNEKQIDLDLSGYNSGLYLLKACSPDNSLIKTIKILVQD